MSQAGLTMGISFRHADLYGAPISGPTSELIAALNGLADSRYLGASPDGIDANNRVKVETRAPSRAARLRRSLALVQNRIALQTATPTPAMLDVQVAIQQITELVFGKDSSGNEDEHAADTLQWRQAADDAHMDGIFARKLGLPEDCHGLDTTNKTAQALASAFLLGWHTADGEARRDEALEAARLFLLLGTPEARDALRAAMGNLPTP